MSSPTGTPNSKATSGLTPRDIELLAFGMQSMKDTNVRYLTTAFLLYSLKLSGMEITQPLNWQ